MWQDIDELIIQLNDDFSAMNLRKLVSAVGAIDESSIPREVDLNQLVYLISNTGEIYSKTERDYIKEIGSVFVFPDTPRTISRGIINCRVVGADLTNTSADLFSAVLFMKIVSKALDGWTQFFLRLRDGIHIGMRVYGRDETRTCTIADGKSLALICDEMTWVYNQSDFLKLYNSMLEVITPEDSSKSDFDTMAVKRRGYQSEYIEGLRELERTLNLDFAGEIERYRLSYKDEEERDFYQDLEEALDTFKDIKSSKINTLEMLFEAEELETIANEQELRYAQSIDSVSAYVEVSNNDVKLAGDDPESLIKMLKAKKGII